MKKANKLLALVVALVFVFSICGIALANPEQKTVDGQGDYFVTGEAYPTMIQMAGYNSRDNKLYVNFAAAAAVGTLATFDYFLEVFNGSSVIIGNVGTYDTPAPTVTGNSVTNKDVFINDYEVSPEGIDLPAAFRVVITVKSYTLAP